MNKIKEAGSESYKTNWGEVLIYENYRDFFFYIFFHYFYIFFSFASRHILRMGNKRNQMAQNQIVLLHLNNFDRFYIKVWLKRIVSWY